MSRRTLHQYKLRLTNLSQSNRSLKLARLSSYKDVDLRELAEANRLNSKELLDKIVAGKSVDLIRSLSAREERINFLDRRLNRIYREKEKLYEESGSDDLFFGFPFVEGKFLNGAVARCPVLLFPVRLVRNLSGRPRWKLEHPKGESIQFNRTFFLAYEKFQQIRLPKGFWEEEIDHQRDLQSLLNHLYGFFKDQDLALNFNSDLFQFQAKSFPPMNKEQLEKLPMGKLKFHPYGILGIFPQSDSALVRDYDLLEQVPEQFPVERILNYDGSAVQERYIPENERYFVTPVDQSQEEALLAVRNGQSVVVHGPPGTGKSQVILNLVADGLARGQKILVCSQKRAALDVVYRRMSELGLGSFAALVHDYRGDRSKIFEKIRDQIDSIEAFKESTRQLSVSAWERSFRMAARKIDEYNHFFEDLYQGLQSVDRFGISPHQLYLRAHEDSKPLGIQAASLKFDQETLAELLRKLKGIFQYQEFFKYEYPWRKRKPFHPFDLGKERALRLRLESLKADFETLVQHYQDIAFREELPLDPDLAWPLLHQWDELLTPVEEGSTVAFDLAALEGQDLKSAYVKRKLGSLKKIFLAMQEFQILDQFNLTHFYDLKSHLEHYQGQKRKFGRMLSLPYLRARWYLQTILKEKQLKLKQEPLAILQREFRVLQRLIDHVQSFEGQHFFEDLLLTDSVDNLLAWQSRKSQNHQLFRTIRQQKKWSFLRPVLASGSDELDAAHLAEAKAALEKTRLFLHELVQQVEQWNHWLHPDQVRALVQMLRHPAEFHLWLEHIEHALEQDMEDLKTLDHLLSGLNAREKEVMEGLEPYLAGVKPGGEEALLEQVENSFYLYWLEALESDFPALARVSSRVLGGQQEEYRQMVKDRQEKVIRLIVRKLRDSVLGKIEYNRLGNPITYREIGHQVRKKRMLWSVRRLVRETWETGLSTLLPCWLASPESVSAVFPMERDYFDLVIFDEASQCYVERAVPVMLRGRQVVIAGDDKQLPPFDLYNIKIEEDEADLETTGMALEVESALDLAKSTFQEIRLSWHYRSQEEELINFSNHAFYQGRLKIIPPAVPSPQAPIEFIQVNGLWERSRNQVEAIKVLELVEELIQKPNPPSIGIVTFNFPQKELIGDLLDARIEALSSQGKQELNALYQQCLYREEGEERQGIFIKNIENVQGDERDIIIFSVGYAQDERGKLRSNFGLLNQKGGENRLNVAITRARKRILLVCSFDPAELDVDSSKHPGPRLFKSYLRYAREVSAGNSPGIQASLNQVSTASEALQNQISVMQGLGDAVARDLEAVGMRVVRNIGDTSYQLDLGLIDGEGEFLLGIECEGDQYFSGKSSKEREVYRRNLLEKRGWKLYRVWARNYFRDREGEIKKILKMVQE